jgi:hypothetical protein
MGAVFEGQCRYLQDPLSQSGSGAPAQPQVAQPAPRPANTFGGGSVFGDPSEDRMVSGVIVGGSN